MKEKKQGDKRRDGNKGNAACSHAMLEKHLIIIYCPNIRAKKGKKDLDSCHIINITDNTGKKLVRRAKTADQLLM